MNAFEFARALTLLPRSSRTRSRSEQETTRPQECSDKANARWLSLGGVRRRAGWRRYLDFVKRRPSAYGLIVLLGALGGCARDEQKPHHEPELAKSVSALRFAAAPFVIGARDQNSIDLFALAVNGQGNVQQHITTHDVKSQVALADINGDGLDEVIVGSGAGIRAYTQTGQLLVGPQQFATGGLFVPGDVIATGDFNGDQVDEVVFGNHGATDIIFVLPTTPGVNVGRAPSSTLFPAGSDLTACDLNNDGKDEIIVAPSYEIFEVQYVPSTPPNIDLVLAPTLPTFFPSGQPD